MQTPDYALQRKEKMSLMKPQTKTIRYLSATISMQSPNSVTRSEHNCVEEMQIVSTTSLNVKHSAGNESSNCLKPRLSLQFTQDFFRRQAEGPALLRPPTFFETVH